MDDHSKKMLDLVYNEAKKIPGIYDLVLRGSGSRKDRVKPFVQGWSDLDFSIIVEEITPEVREKVRSLYNLTREYTDMKMSFILVDTQDFFSKYHLHGIKPMNYTAEVFNRFQSLIKGDISYVNRESGPEYAYRISCYTYLSYYIHDVRIRHLMCGNTLPELRSFFHYLVKRANVISWNAIFLTTGYTGDTCVERLYEQFPKLDKDFWETIKQIRTNWAELKYDAPEMLRLIDYVFENIEYIYKEVVKYAEEHVFQSGQELDKTKKLQAIK